MRIDLHIHLDERVAEQLDRMEEKLGVSIDIMEIIMAASDALKQAMADLQAQLQENNAEIDVLMLKAGTPDADVQTAIDQIRQIIADNKAKVEAAKAV
jgi:hypothetical protein